MSTEDLRLIDCFFYFDGNGCAKPTCPYRHCPKAKKNTEVCTDWLSGECTWYNCPKRHMHKAQNDETSVLEQLIAQGFSSEEAQQASSQTTNLESALSYLQRRCDICSGTLPHSEMFCLITCEHSMCRDCAVTHFETQIKSNAITSIVCPYADCVDLTNKDDIEVHEYFALLISQLKGILRSDLIELLEKKLLDWSLVSDPNFMYCPQCGDGMFKEEIDNNFVECYGCGTRICPNCKKVWTQQHVGVTCDQFEALIENKNVLQNDEELLEKFLSSFGVECPSCRTKFVKSSGGCLHFTCTVCQHQFCDGCLQPFYKKGACPQLSHAGMGFHAHHPRNCFFYVRDWTPQRLQRLLALNKITYETNPKHSGTKCPLVEQKEKEDKKLVDEECGEDMELNSAGLCRKHYIQYLGWLVLKNKVDPILLYTAEELEQVLMKARIPLPIMSTNYLESLQDLVKGLKQTGVLSNTNTISEAYAPFLDEKLEKSDKKDQRSRRKEFSLDDDDDDDEDYTDDDENYEESDQPNTLMHWACEKCCFINFPGTLNCAGCEFANYKEDEELLGATAAAAAPLSSAASNAVPPNMWECRFCTFANAEPRKVCNVCCRTRRVSLDDYELCFDGVECHSCTLINEPGVVQCVLCMTALNVD
uniref:RanBP-type and C3HC4-type zinc finger-containing protein 1 n=1 Tax=Strigamia maritima TaxID=126957 RepID=T1JBZ7_STRMM